MSNMGRQTQQYVEIDLPFCTRVYGTSPCTAALGTTGVRKCFNSFFTCQDVPNFEKGTRTLTFARNENGIPKGQNIFPVLQSVSTSPIELSLGSPAERLGTLGKRARVTIRLTDFQYADALIDKYQQERISGTAQTDESGYDPYSRSSFFAKLRARQQYFAGITLRVKNGNASDTIASIPSRTYVIDEINGPDANGNVTIVALDPIDLTDDRKAVYPPLSTGAVGADFDETELAQFTLMPAGSGSGYAASGRATIGREVVTFTRSGDDITITARGVDGTEASSHNMGDAFQQCARFEDADIHTVANTLFTAAGVPSSMIPLTEWETESTRWLPGISVTRTITKPTGIRTLLSELCNLGIIFFYDELAASIRLRANRPIDVALGESATSLSDDNSVIEGSLRREDLISQVLTQVWFWHGTVNPTESATDNKNYSRVDIGEDVELESANALGQVRRKDIFMPWLGEAGDNVTALVVSARFQNRYGRPQSRVTFDVDVKDKDAVELTDFINLTTRAIVNDVGISEPEPMQVIMRDDIDPGHRIRLSAETFQFTGRFAYYTQNNRPTYANSSEQQRTVGGYYGPNTGLEFSDGTPIYQYF